jgi:hypothetical protein
MARHRFATYHGFLPYYVAMHSRPATRWVHLAGTLAGALVAASGVLQGRWRRLAALPAMGYGAAWPSHWLIERNNPASFGHPLWSLRGDFHMIRTMLAGRDAELSEVAAGWLRDHPEDRHAGSITVPA